MEKHIRILLVDDDELFMDAVDLALSYDPRLEVVGRAADGRQGVALARTLKPDIITMDIHMPVMNGLDAVAAIMAECPAPIVMLSTDYTEQRVFAALERGALDVLEKPSIQWTEPETAEFCARLRLLAGTHVLSRPAAAQLPPVVLPVAALQRAPAARGVERAPARVVGVACSTGGPQALKVLLGALPVDFPACLLVVQHIQAGFTHSLVQWLNTACAIDVRLARDGEPVRRGTALIAPDGVHLLVDRGGTVRLSGHDDGTGYRPSADATFDALASAYGASAVGVVLTGAGSDGAVGLARIAKRGGATLCQDPADAVVDGMPREAIATGQVRLVAPLARLAALIAATVALPGHGGDGGGR